MATLILGASTKPFRYSYKATERLLAAGESVVLIGGREGSLFGVPIQVGNPRLLNIDTVTMYLNQDRQESYVEYILEDIKPKRIIFNPGAENLKLAMMAKAAGIEVLHACTLVMLATNQWLTTSL
ncbi:MAG: CoA-binding protein [Saprospiraceae bacterium]